MKRYSLSSIQGFDEERNLIRSLWLHGWQGPKLITHKIKYQI
jgi:Holliday junction resolvase